MFGLSIIAAIMGRAVQQDFEYRVEHFFFTAPIRKWEYLAGRFAGAIVVLLVILSSIALGGALGLLLPGLDPDRIGPVRPLAYLLPYFTVLLPNLLVLGGLFFCLAALTRRMLPVYIGSVLLSDRLPGRAGPAARHGQQDAGVDARPVRRRRDVATDRVLVDQRAQHAAGAARRTAALEPAAVARRSAPRSSRVTTWRFRMAQAGASGPPRARPPADDGSADVVAVQLRRVDARRRSAALRLLPRLVWLNFRETVKNVYFGVIAFAGVLFLVVDQLDGRRHLRHQHVAGDVADAGPRCRARSPSSCW